MQLRNQEWQSTTKKVSIVAVSAIVLLFITFGIMRYLNKLETERTQLQISKMSDTLYILALVVPNLLILVVDVTIIFLILWLLLGLLGNQITRAFNKNIIIITLSVISVVLALLIIYSTFDFKNGPYTIGFTIAHFWEAMIPVKPRDGIEIKPVATI